MDQWISTLITVVCSMAASTGFWAFIQSRMNKNDAKSKMILGLGHDRLLYLCLKYLERGSITSDELENLQEYLYVPYEQLKGNGTVARLMKKVDALPITRGAEQNIKQEVPNE